MRSAVPPPQRPAPLPPSDNSDYDVLFVLIEQIQTTPNNKHKHYASTIFPSEWNAPTFKDYKLSSELCGTFQRGFSARMIGIEIYDIWLPNRYRVATFSASDKCLIDHFVFQCNSNQIKCGNRFVRAYYKYDNPNHYKCYKVFVLNINCRIRHTQFKKWTSTNMKIPVQSVGKIESWICVKKIPVKQNNICIVEFDRQSKQIRDMLIAFPVIFRNHNLNFSFWSPRDSMNMNTMSRQVDAYDKKCKEVEMYRRKLEALQRQVNAQQTQQIQSTAHINNLQQVNSSLTNQLYQINNENTHIKGKYNDLFVKFAMLKGEKVNEGCYEYYMGWNTEDVLVWIFNLENGRYVKYKHIIVPMAYSIGINGATLINVTIQFLYKLGITDILDVQSLINHVKNLTTQHNKNAAYLFHNEGH